MRAACLFALLVVSAGCDQSTPLTAAVDVSATQSATVGGRAQLVVVVQNTGPTIAHLGLVFRSTHKWYEEHTITDASGCTIASDHSAFDCGDLNAGETMTFAIAGIAQEAGTFHYELALRELVRPFHYVNDHADGADAHTWEEVVRAG